MRTLLVLLVALSVAACGGSSSPEGGAAGLPGPLPRDALIAPPDTTAPRADDFVVTLLDGTRVEASELWSERPLVVDFLASWCDRCGQHQSDLNELARDYDGLVAFLAVAHGDEPDDLREYLRDHDVPFAAAIDDSGKTWRRYAVSEPPVVVVIGKGGRLLRGWSVDVPKETLDEVLARLAAHVS